MVRALAGDSTMTRGLGISFSRVGRPEAPLSNRLGSRPRELHDPHHLIETFGTIGIHWPLSSPRQGLLAGFFLPGYFLLFTAGLLASQGTLTSPSSRSAASLAAVVGSANGVLPRPPLRPRAFPIGPIRVVLAEYVDRARRPISPSTGRARSCWPASSRWCGRSQPWSPASAGWRPPHVPPYNVVGGFLWGDRGHHRRLLLGQDRSRHRQVPLADDRRDHRALTDPGRSSKPANSGLQVRRSGEDQRADGPGRRCHGRGSCLRSRGPEGRRHGPPPCGSSGEAVAAKASPPTARRAKAKAVASAWRRGRSAST